MSLLPYGSSKFAGLTAKIADVGKAPSRQAHDLLPYGAAGNTALTSKVLSEGKTASGKADPRRVARLNAG